MFHSDIGARTKSRRTAFENQEKETQVKLDQNQCLIDLSMEVLMTAMERSAVSRKLMKQIASPFKNTTSLSSSKKATLPRKGLACTTKHHTAKSKRYMNQQKSKYNTKRQASAIHTFGNEPTTNEESLRPYQNPTGSSELVLDDEDNNSVPIAYKFLLQERRLSLIGNSPRGDDGPLLSSKEDDVPYDQMPLSSSSQHSAASSITFDDLSLLSSNKSNRRYSWIFSSDAKKEL